MNQVLQPFAVSKVLTFAEELDRILYVIALRETMIIHKCIY